VVEHLPSKHKTLSSTLVPERKEGRKEKEKKKKREKEYKNGRWGNPEHLECSVKHLSGSPTSVGGSVRKAMAS
jgi:hypothetical protein